MMMSRRTIRIIRCRSCDFSVYLLHKNPLWCMYTETRKGHCVKSPVSKACKRWWALPPTPLPVSIFDRTKDNPAALIFRKLGATEANPHATGGSSVMRSGHPTHPLALMANILGLRLYGRRNGKPARDIRYVPARLTTLRW